MGLVDYSDASSDEDEEEVQETPEIVVPSKKLVLPPVKSTNLDISDDDEKKTTEALIHSKLPKAQKIKPTLIQEEKEDEFLKKVHLSSSS